VSTSSRTRICPTVSEGHCHLRPNKLWATSRTGCLVRIRDAQFDEKLFRGAHLQHLQSIRLPSASMTPNRRHASRKPCLSCDRRAPGPQPALFVRRLMPHDERECTCRAHWRTFLSHCRGLACYKQGRTSTAVASGV
jgi:hypothetical protein